MLGVCWRTCVLETHKQAVALCVFFGGGERELAEEGCSFQEGDRVQAGQWQELWMGVSCTESGVCRYSSGGRLNSSYSCGGDRASDRAHAVMTV